MATPLRFYSPSYFEHVARQVYGGVTGRDRTRRASASGVRLRLPPNAYGYAMQLAGGMSRLSWTFLPHIRHETLVVCGDDDPLVPLDNAPLSPHASRAPRSRSSSAPATCRFGTSPSASRRRSARFFGWS